MCFLNSEVDKPMQGLPQSTPGCSLVHQALREYSAIVKNKQYPQAGRLRANIGNIYYEQVTSAHTTRALRISARSSLCSIATGRSLDSNIYFIHVTRHSDRSPRGGAVFDQRRFDIFPSRQTLFNLCVPKIVTLQMPETYIISPSLLLR